METKKLLKWTKQTGISKYTREQQISLNNCHDNGVMRTGNISHIKKVEFKGSNTAQKKMGQRVDVTVY